MKTRSRRELYPGAKTVIAIDPGLNGTGWAIWQSPTVVPLAVGTIRSRPEGSLAQRSHDLLERMKEQMFASDALTLMWRRESTYVFIELPQHFAASAKGIAAQAGSVYSLTFLVGYLACGLHPCSVITFTPNEWKGQLPKHIVEDRVRKWLGTDVCQELNIRTHAWDAVGLGLYAIGKF